MESLFWAGLYPNSIAVKESAHIYVGMLAGYAVVNTETQQVSFFKFKNLK